MCQSNPFLIYNQYNLRQMKNSVQTHLTHIRRKHRNQEINRLKNSLRFKNEVELFTQEDATIQLDIEISNQQLQSWLRQQNLSKICEAILHMRQDNLYVLEDNIIALIDFLFRYLSMPKGINALGNLCRRVECAAVYIFQKGKFGELVDYLQNLPFASNQQNIYLFCIIRLLQKPSYVCKDQFKELYNIIELIFKAKLQNEKENTLVIRLITFMLIYSDSNDGFSEYFINLILDYYWQTDNQSNLMNIINIAQKIIYQQIYPKSLPILIKSLRIALQKRHYDEIQNKSHIIFNPALYSMRIYNKFWEQMQDECSINLGQQTLKTGIHDFFLLYESFIFQIGQKNQTFYEFLEQFVKNGNSQQIITNFSENGLLQQMRREMVISPQTCFYSLKVIISLLARSAGTSRQKVIMILDLHNFKQVLEQIPSLFLSEEINRKLELVWSFLMSPK